MKILCAWHKKNFGIELVMQEGSEPASHGICAECSAMEHERPGLPSAADLDAVAEEERIKEARSWLNAK
jgi:hypothetical protein